jgi:hypothetical protein
MSFPLEANEKLIFLSVEIIFSSGMSAQTPPSQLILYSISRQYLLNMSIFSPKSNSFELFLPQNGHFESIISVPANLLLIYPCTGSVSSNPANCDTIIFLGSRCFNASELCQYEAVTHCNAEQLRPCGLTDKAPDFESGDCRFESCHGRSPKLLVARA